MTGIRITFTIDDIQAVTALRRLEAAGHDATGLFASIGEHLVRATEDHFRDEVDPDGNPWTPNALHWHPTRARAGTGGHGPLRYSRGARPPAVFA